MRRFRIVKIDYRFHETVYRVQERHFVFLWFQLNEFYTLEDAKICLDWHERERMLPKNNTYIPVIVTKRTVIEQQYKTNKRMDLMCPYCNNDVEVEEAYGLIGKEVECQHCKNKPLLDYDEIYDEETYEEECYWFLVKPEDYYG
jgi:hypothetical protein